MGVRVLVSLLIQPHDHLEAPDLLVLLGLLILTLVMCGLNLQYAQDTHYLHVPRADGLYTNGMELHGI